MTRRSRAAALAALVVSPAFAAMAVALVATSGPIRSIARGPLEHGEKIGRTRAWLEASGFYPAELDGDHSFSWMRDAGRIRLLHLKRSTPYKLSLWVQPAVVNMPVRLTAAVDGVALAPVPLRPGPQRIDIDILPADSDRANVDLAVSETLIPGPADRRALGMRVDDVGFEAGESRIPIPSESVRALMMAGIAIGILVAITLRVRPLAFAVGPGAGAWIGFLVSFDGAFLGHYPDDLRTLAISFVAVAIVIGLAARRLESDGWGLRPLFGVLAVVTACQVALFLHPMVAVGDSIFHVHRAQVVQRGEYFFTSITPKPYFEFPYAPGLYVAVMPLWNLFRGDTGHTWLLRLATLIAEAGLGLGVYWLVLGHWRDRAAAFISAVLTVLLPVGLYTICTSNLSNSFAQSMFGIGLAALLVSAIELRWRSIVAAIGCAFVCAGFLSHFSTFSVGVPLLATCAAALWLGGPGKPRRMALTLVFALAIAAGVSVAVYYAHFVPVYKQTIERVLAKEESGDRSMVAPASTKATRIVSTVWREFGTAALLAALAGAALLLRARVTDPLSLTVAGWSVVIAGFWLLAVISPVEMRASLAAQPLVAILAGTAIARGLERGGPLRIAAACTVAAILLRAISDWRGCLGLDGFWRL